MFLKGLITAKHVESIFKRFYFTLQDKGRQDHEPVDLLNSNNRPKPRRRTSKFSESEDSTVSTDSPLNPRNVSKVYTGGVHSVHSVQGDQGVHSSQDTETNEITSSR